MQIVTSEKEFLETVDYLKNCGKSVGRFAFNGTIHDGHKHILEKVRPQCDILVTDLVNYMILNSFPNSNLIEKQLVEIGVKVDFFIVNNFGIDVEKKRKESESRYEEFFSYGKLVNLNNNILVSSASMERTSLIDYVSTSYIGPKNAVTVLLAEKILGRKLSWVWKIIWSCYRGKDSVLVSRSRGSLVLSKIVLSAAEQIKKGITDGSSFEKLMQEYYIENPKFTILDLKTIEKLDFLSDNCVLVFSESKQNDFIFIKEGELIF